MSEDGKAIEHRVSRRKTRIMPQRKLTIGISGINAADNPGPGIGISRSLKEALDLDVTIVGLAYDAMEPGIYMDWMVDKTYMMPYPSGETDAYLSRLLHIKQTYGLDAIIPCLDAELPLYIKSQDWLRDHGIETFLPNMEQFRLRSKDRLGDIADQIGASLPVTEVVTSHEMLMAAVNKIGFPCMVKGCFYKAYKAHTVGEAVAHFNHLVAEWGYPILVQQVVTGDELNVVGLGDGEGNALGLCGIKKVSVTALGKIWTGVTIKHEGMLQASEAFIKMFRWRGPFELECIVSGEKIYLIEVNPRFPAWSYFATGVGMNLPAQLIRHAFKLPSRPMPDYPSGKLFVRYSYELITDLAPFQALVTRGESL